MNADEAWEEFMRRPSSIAKRDASLQGQLDTMQAQLNELATATQLMTQIANKVLGDGGEAAGDAPPGLGGAGGAPGGAPPGADPMAAMMGGGMPPGGAPPGGAPGGDPMAALMGGAGGGAPPGAGGGMPPGGPGGGEDPMAALMGGAGGEGGMPPGGEEEGGDLASALGGAGGEGEDFSRIDELLARMGGGGGGAEEGMEEGMPGEEGMEEGMDEAVPSGEGQGGSPDDVQAAFDNFLNSLKYLAHDAVDNGMMEVIDEVAALINSLNSMYKSKILPILEQLGAGGDMAGMAEGGSARDMAGLTATAEDGARPGSGGDMSGGEGLFKSARKPAYYKMRKTIGGTGSMDGGDDTGAAPGAADGIGTGVTPEVKTDAAPAAGGDTDAPSAGADGPVSSKTASGSGYLEKKAKKRYVKRTGAPSVDAAMRKSASYEPPSFRSFMKARSAKKASGAYDRILKGGALDVDAANGTVTGWNEESFDDGDRATWFSGRIDPDSWDYYSKDEDRDFFSQGARNRMIDVLRMRPSNFDALHSLLSSRDGIGIKRDALTGMMKDHVSAGGDPADTGFNVCKTMLDIYDDAEALFPGDIEAAWDPGRIIGHLLEDADNSWKQSADSEF